MKVFADTNILVDFISGRQPHGLVAKQIFNKAEQGKIQLFTSSHAIATSHYVLKREHGEEKLRATLNELMDIVSVIPVDEQILKRSLKSIHKDFEDAIQIICAQSISKMSCIITRNGKDFKGSDIPVHSPDEFLLKWDHL